MTDAPTPEGSSPPDKVPSRAGLARNAFHLVLGQVTTTTMGIFLSAALGRGLGPVDFGLYYLITTMAAFGLVVVDWGQGMAVVREVARHPSKSGRFLGAVLGLRAGGTALAAGITAMAARLTGQTPRTSALAAALVIAMLPFFLAQAYGLVFRASERMDLDATVTVLNKVLTLALTVAALGSGFGLVGVIAAQGLSGLGALAGAVLVGRKLRLPRIQPTFAAAREILGHGTPIVALTIAMSAQGYIDALVLAKLAPEPVVGWYGAARNIIGTLIAPASIIAIAAYPRLARVAHDTAAFRRELHTALRPLLALGALAAVGTYLFADLAVAIIYGKKAFGPVGTTLKVFAPGLFLLFVDVQFAGAVAALGRTRQLAAAKLFNVLATTALDLLLIPFFQARFGNGGIGVVTAFALSEAIMFAAAVWILPRGSFDRSMIMDIGRALLAGLLTLALFSLAPSLPVYVKLPACIAAFAALARATGLVRGDDVDALRRVFLEKLAGARGAS